MEGSYADLIDSFTIKTKPDKKRKTKCATKHTKTAKIATEFLKKSFEEPKTVFVSNEALFEKIKNAKKSNFRLNQLILTDTDENLKKETDEIPPDDIKSREAFLESVIKEATNDFLRADFWKDQKNAKMRAFSSIEDSAEKEEGLFIGFVRVEGDGRLNKQSCVLQGCREISAGAKVKLDFTRHQHADAMSLFPGKIIVVDGYMEDCDKLNKRLMVHEIIDCIPFVQPPLSRGSSWSPFSILIAAGPFTSTDSFEYTDSPFSALVSSILFEKPSGIGPFLSPKANIEKSCDKSIFDAFDALLDAFMIDIKAIADDLPENFHIFVSPSVEDINVINVFPQKPLYFSKINPFHASKNVIFLSNPCTISLNGCEIALSATDFAFDMICSDFRLGTAAKEHNRWQEITENCLKQKSFYPMYPPKTPIDFSKMAHLQIKTIPDVLVWTSPSNKISPKIAGAFKLFGTLPTHSVAVYPGHTGCYAKLTVLAEGKTVEEEREILVEIKQIEHFF